MESKEIVFRFMYMALIEIRAASHEEKNKKCYKISTLIHTIPLKLLKVEKGEEDYSELLKWIFTRSKEIGCHEWVQNIVKHIETEK